MRRKTAEMIVITSRIMALFMLITMVYVELLGIEKALNNLAEIQNKFFLECKKP